MSKLTTMTKAQLKRECARLQGEYQETVHMLTTFIGAIVYKEGGYVLEKGDFTDLPQGMFETDVRKNGQVALLYKVNVEPSTPEGGVTK